VLQIRLAGINSSRSQGRVEVNYDRGEWGTICDTNWGIGAADVVCRMLGFGSALEATNGASPFGEGHGSVLLDDVMCIGNETSLLVCSHSGFGEHSCLHRQDAGVICSSEFY
jgi:deleted-in-malignant-brain-tumors protein 1